MLFNIGDYVTRNSYNNDLVFKIKEIRDNTVILEGVNVRLIADAEVSDLSICDDCLEDITKDDRAISDEIEKFFCFDRDSYFYLPGKVLQLDSSSNFLDRCINFYKKMNIASYGKVCKEKDLDKNIMKYLNEVNPDIVVITGHDAYYDKNDDYENLNNYKNSLNFINAVKEARKYEKDHEKLIIIAGACQSNYEELIKAGANFASSPKRINIHALDPAVIATSLALSSKNKMIDLKNILERTKYGKDGIGGIITNGAMYVGYPR